MDNMDSIKNKIKFLNDNDLNKYTFQIRKIKNNRIHLECNDHIGVKHKTTEQVSSCGEIVTVFTEILDKYVNIKYSQHGNEHFAEKYKILPCNTDKEIIFKETYYIWKELRHVPVHNGTIKENNGKIYFEKNNNIIMIIDKDILDCLYSLACEYFSDDINKYHSNNYHLGILRFYYKKIRDNIIANNNTVNMQDISNGICIKVTRVRNFIIDAKYTLNNDSINIEKYESGKELGYGSDYMIIYNSQEYCIPVEALDQTGDISINDIDQWKVDNQLVI